jgi:phage protein D
MSDKLQASIPVASIKVGGQSVAIAEHDLEEIVIDTTYNLPAMATIRLHDPKLRWADGDTFAMGDKLSITLGPSRSMEDVQAGEVFVGEIVALEPTLSALGTNTFTIRGYDLSHRLHIGTKSRTFLNMSDADIVTEIARGLGINTGDVATLPKQKYILQNNLSDFEFLSVRAKRAGCLFSIVSNKVNFQKPEKMKTGPILELGETLRQLSLRMSSARQAQKLIVRGWDFRAKQAIVGNNVPAVLWNKNGLNSAGGAAAKTAFGMNGLSNLTTFAPQTKDEADAIALAAAVDQEGYFTEADGVAYGHPGLVAGVQVELKEMGKKYSGKYYVTSATHIYNAAGYETHFTVAGRYPQTFNQLLNGAPAGATEPGSIHGVVVGVVTNVKDDENLGRVKVKFPWLADDSASVESNWARIAAPSAGKDRGFYFLPEVDDEVLVAFEHGNANYPYIVGMLWNGKDTPSEQNSVAHTGEGTIHRMIVSRLGHRIVFDDSNSKKSILIEDSTKNQSIFIDAVKNDITIKGSGNLLIDIKGNIDIKAGGNINIEATGNIKADAMNIEMNAKTNFKVDAKSMMEMKAVGIASFESATGMAALKGAMVDVNATGDVSIMGAMIMLN